jgi:hypothetical protein
VPLNRFKLIFLLTLANCIWIQHAAAAPAIFWFNDPVDPNDTVLVAGAELGDVSTVTIGRVPDRDQGDGKATTRNVTVLQASPQSLKFVVPPELEPGIYHFTLASPHGHVSGRINLPTVYWARSARPSRLAAGSRSSGATLSGGKIAHVSN